MSSINRFATIIALLAPALYAADSADADAPWLAKALPAARETVNSWLRGSEGVAAELQFFHSELPPASSASELPESPNGDTIILCDRGLLFDAKTSRLVYVGNVRMRDSRITMLARDNFFLRLEELGSDKSDKNNKKAPAAKPTPTAKSAPATAPTPAAKPAPATKPAAAKPKTDDAAKQEEPQIPLHIVTGSAEANVVDNRIILYSPAGSAPIDVTRGEDRLIVTPSESAPAQVLADSQGNILLEGKEIHMTFTNRDGGKSIVDVSGGPAYYHAENRTLYLKGDIRLTHPNGKLSCTESLCLSLLPGDNKETRKGEFMSQFAGLSFSGIHSATARGQVCAETGGVNGSQPGTAQGDVLVYNSETGHCSITGSNSRLTYGANNTIYANEGIHLMPNGDIELRGTDIHGTYERPAQKEGVAPVCGTFKAGANIIFRADTGHVTTDNGLVAQDAESEFSCTGPVRLTLSRKSGSTETEEKPGLPNLAITEFGDIVTIQAQGDVNAARKVNGKVISTLKGDCANINMANGSASLTSSANAPAILTHESNRLEATPGSEPAKLDILENGDIQLFGKHLAITLKNKNRVTTVTGRQSMSFIRSENRVNTGSGVVLKSPSAIITTTGPVSAVLQPEEKKDEKPANHAFARHSFNYSGIRTADTYNGGTVRTAKGSMQCTGPIHVQMDPKAGENHELGGVQHAVANGNVMLLMQDASKRRVRASGDRLTVNGNTGMKVLTGRQVVLENESNRHTVSGKGAAIHVDKRNNVRITGALHDTKVTKLDEQAKKQKKQNSQKKDK